MKKPTKRVRRKKEEFRPMCMGCLGTGHMEGYGKCPNCGGTGNDTIVRVRITPLGRGRK